MTRKTRLERMYDRYLAAEIKAKKSGHKIKEYRMKIAARHCELELKKMKSDNN